MMKMTKGQYPWEVIMSLMALCFLFAASSRLNDNPVRAAIKTGLTLFYWFASPCFDLPAVNLHALRDN